MELRITPRKTVADRRKSGERRVYEYSGMVTSEFRYPERNCKDRRKAEANITRFSILDRIKEKLIFDYWV